ncbi:hypothetical protein DKP78_25310, partial [Enterococcus faecium]
TVAAFAGLVAADVDEGPEGSDELRLQGLETEDQVEVLGRSERQTGAGHMDFGRRPADQCVLIFKSNEGRLEHINAYDHP